jgi:hypothetical protein
MFDGEMCACKSGYAVRRGVCEPSPRDEPAAAGQVADAAGRAGGGRKGEGRGGAGEKRRSSKRGGARGGGARGGGGSGAREAAEAV